MRVVVLWTRLSGYLGSCLAALADADDTEVFLECEEPTGDAPYGSPEVVPPGIHLVPRRIQLEGPELLATVLEMAPDVLLVSGWQIPAYRYVARRIPYPCLRVLCMDNQWRGTAKQWLGAATRRRYLWPLFDVAFLPGDRQAVFARKLGFSGGRIWPGLYSCDHGRFASARIAEGTEYPDGEAEFIYVGRLAAEKGIDTLATAYRLYREWSDMPWPLIVCGRGPLEDRIAVVPGVETRGFLQPSQLAPTLARAACLVLPSLLEPWGVAVHEATAAGVPVICSGACGAAPHLVEDGYNGYIVQSGDAPMLARAMLRCASLSPAERAAMGANGAQLSSRYTPERWAADLTRRARDAIELNLRSERGRPLGGAVSR